MHIPIIMEMKTISSTMYNDYINMAIILFQQGIITIGVLLLPNNLIPITDKLY